MKARKILILAAVLMVVVPVSLSAAKHTKESLADVKEKIDEEKGVLIDVREKREWESGHIEDAILLPLSALRDGASKEELKSLPEKKVLYLHCAAGKRALVAGEILERQGYKVAPLKPGYKELISAGFVKAKE